MTNPFAFADTTPAPKRAALRLLGLLAQTAHALIQGRMQANQSLWDAKAPADPMQPPHPQTNPLLPLAPELVAAEIPTNQLRAGIISDLLQRANLAVVGISDSIAADQRPSAALSALAASSPIPAGYTVTLVDANAATVDVSTELAALVAALASVTEAHVIKTD